MLTVSSAVAPENAMQIHQASLTWALRYKDSPLLILPLYLTVGCSVCQPALELKK
jgi:hypothetical protein